MLVCESVSVCGSPSTNPPWKPQKMWREICVDQDHKYSEVKVWSLSLSLLHVFSLSETSCRLKRHHSLWNWQHAWQWPHLRSHICHPSISPSFHLSIFPFFHWAKQAHFIPPKEMSSSHFQPTQSFSSQMGQSHLRYSWTIFQTQTHSVEDCEGLLLHKTGIRCSFVGLFYWRNKLYWASEWLKMSEE